MAEKTIDTILWIEGFYPFSLKYDLEKAVEAHIQELETLEFDETSNSIFKFSDYFNSYFKEICKELDKIIGKSTLTKSNFIDLIISDLNRTELIISENVKRNLLSSSWFDSNMPANVYIQKPEFQNNTEPVSGLIEGAMYNAPQFLDSSIRCKNEYFYTI